MTSTPTLGADTVTARDGGTGSKHLGLALFVISVAQLMVVLDATIVNVALPSIQNALGFSGASLEWVVTAYTLTFGGLLLLGGRMGDVLGRRRVFVGGILLFSVASLAGGFAQASWWLLAARGLQGVGAAVMAATSLSLITTNFPEGRERNRAMGVYAAMSGAGAAIGLIAGGLLTDYASWRWVLFVNVPIGLLCAFAAPRALVESERQRGRFDVPGALSATAGVMLLVYGLTHGSPTQKVVNGKPVSVSHWTDPATIVTLVLSVVLLVTFVVIERRSPHALMPLRIFRNLSRSGAYLVSLFVGTAMFGMFFFLTIFVQRVWGYSPLRTGVAFLPVSAGIVVVAGISSQLMSKMSARSLMIPGVLLAAAGMFWLSFVDEHSHYAGGLLGPMLVTAAGLGLAFVPLTLVAVAGVDNEEAGLASGLLNTGQQVGGSIGLAVLGTVVFTAIGNYGPTAFRLAGKSYGSYDHAHPPAALVKSANVMSLSHGISLGFLVASLVMVLALGITIATIRVRREEMQGAEALPEAA
jgi:EmrB/QacA subfamily drug resistance transporter